MDIVLSEKFAQFILYRGYISFKNGEKIKVVLEERRFWNDETLCFLKIGEKEYRDRTFYEITQVIKDVSYLAIVHRVFFNREGKIIEGKIIEKIRPLINEDAMKNDGFVRFIFEYDKEIFESDYSQGFPDADLDWRDYLEATGKENIDLMACHTCKYAGHANPYQGWQFWCYRDIPKIDFEILQTQKKRTPEEIRYGGIYYTDIFHCCAAWEERNLT